MHCFVLTKLLGYKQMSQLSMFDYINGISIGSIAAEMATTVDGSFMKPLLAMTIYAVLVYFIDLLAVKSLKFRRFFGGRSLVLFENGKLYKENLRKAKIDVSEFLTECRLLGYFDINDISMAMMENNGKISVLPTTGRGPLMWRIWIRTCRELILKKTVKGKYKCYFRRDYSL